MAEIIHQYRDCRWTMFVNEAPAIMGLFMVAILITGYGEAVYIGQCCTTNIIYAQGVAVVCYIFFCHHFFISLYSLFRIFSTIASHRHHLWWQWYNRFVNSSVFMFTYFICNIDTFVVEILLTFNMIFADILINISYFRDADETVWGTSQDLCVRFQFVAYCCFD